MPPGIQANAPKVFSLDKFIQAAEKIGNKDVAIKVGSQAFHRVGMFNKTATLQKTRDAFLSALRGEYGSDFDFDGDGIVKQLSKDRGKPLTARTILEAAQALRSKAANSATVKKLRDSGMTKLLESGLGLCGEEGFAKSHPTLAKLAKHLDALGKGPKEKLLAYVNRLLVAELDREGSYLAPADGIVHIDAVEKSLAATSILDHLGNLETLSGPENEFERYLDMLDVSKDNRQDNDCGHLKRLITNISKENPGAIDSKKAFAQALKARLSSEPLTEDEEKNLSETIRKCAKELADARVSGGMDVKAEGLRYRLEKAVGKGAETGPDTLAKLALALGNRCKARMSKVFGDDEIKLCYRQIQYKEGVAKKWRALSDGMLPKDLLKLPMPADDELMALSDDALTKRIEMDAKNERGKYREFLFRRNKAKTAATQAIRKLFSDLSKGAELKEEDIDFSAVDKKLPDNAYARYDKQDKINDVFDEKLVKALKNLAKALTAEKESFSEDLKAELFKRACKLDLPSHPGFAEGFCSFVTGVAKKQATFNEMLGKVLSEKFAALPPKEKQPSYVDLVKFLNENLIKPFGEMTTKQGDRDSGGSDDKVPAAELFYVAMQSLDGGNELNGNLGKINDLEDFGKWMKDMTNLQSRNKEIDGLKGVNVGMFMSTLCHFVDKTEVMQ